MLCSEFRDLMFERLAGELDPQQDAACSAHEKSCVICRAELAQFRSVEVRLRAGWPSEDPMPMSVVVPQTARGNWFDVAALWFSRASAGLVAASLLFVVLVRPSVQIGRDGLQFAFAKAPAATSTAAPAVNEAQVKAMVQAAVNQQMAQLRPAATTPAQTPAATKSADVVQVAMQVRQLQHTQETLWEEVQQHGVYLESLWRNNTEANVRPASLSR